MHVARIPRGGTAGPRPMVISVPGVSGVQVNAASSGAAVTFFQPTDGLVTGLLAIPRSGSEAAAAALSLSVIDDASQALFSDGRNGVLSLPFLLLSGRGWRWFPLRAAVKRGSPWIFQVTNGGGSAQVPTVLLRLEPNA